MNLLEMVNRIKELRNDATALSNYIADLTGSDFEECGVYHICKKYIDRWEVYMSTKSHGKKVLAKGRGMPKMLDVCLKKGLNKSNSVLVVKEPNKLDSSWVVYDLPN